MRQEEKPAGSYLHIHSFTLPAQAAFFFAAQFKRNIVLSKSPCIKCHVQLLHEQGCYQHLGKCWS